MKKANKICAAILAASVMAGAIMAFTSPYQDDKIRLDLTRDETNLVIMALSKLPYDQTASTIEKVVAQARPQFAAIAKAADTTKPAAKPPAKKND